MTKQNNNFLMKFALWLVDVQLLFRVMRSIWKNREWALDGVSSYLLHEWLKRTEYPKGLHDTMSRLASERGFESAKAMLGIKEWEDK
jgi:hypothetical protein